MIKLNPSAKERFLKKLELDLLSPYTLKFINELHDKSNEEIFSWFYHLIDGILIDTLLTNVDSDIISAEEFEQWFICNEKFREALQKDRLQRYAELCAYNHCILNNYFK